MNRPLANLTLATLAFAAPALAMTPGIDTSEHCYVTPAGHTVSSWAGVLTYKIQGDCYGYNIVAVGTWASKTGIVTESIPVHDANGNASTFQDTATCPQNPFLLGKQGAGCAPGTKSYPLLPPAVAATIAPPILAGAIPGNVRSVLAGLTLAAVKAENQAPTFLDPQEGATIAGNVRIILQPGDGSPTQRVALEWQKRVDGERGSSWVKADMIPSANVGETTFPAAWFEAGVSGWRVRARAQQAPDANWSDWRTFSRATSASAAVAAAARGIVPPLAPTSAPPKQTPVSPKKP